MFSLLRRHQINASDLLTSQLFDQNSFYRAFMRDLSSCTSEAIIESPFITSNRVASLLPIFGKMRSRNIKITIITRRPAEHDAPYDAQAADAVDKLLDMGVQVIYIGGHHRKLAILDRAITWEGSLNILSQYDSCEIMRKITSQTIAEQMIQFLNLKAHF
jgi:hypothetical protein